MTTITFGNFEPTKIMNPMGNGLEPKMEVRILNPRRTKLKNGLVPSLCKSGEVLMIHPDLVEDMEPPECLVRQKKRKPCYVTYVKGPMVLEEEQSLHTCSGRSFEQEYSPQVRGVATSTGQPTTEKGRECDPFSYDLLDHLQESRQRFPCWIC